MGEVFLTTPVAATECLHAAQTIGMAQRCYVDLSDVAPATFRFWVPANPLGDSTDSRPPSHKTSPASLIVRNGNPDRSAISKRECSSSERLSTQRRALISTPIASPPV